MIKENQKIEVEIIRRNMKEYYESKGYKIDKLGQKIVIDARDLPPGSHKKIVYICDYCGQEFERLPYSNARSQGIVQKDACAKCSRSRKGEETCLEKYQVSNPMKLEEFQTKCQESKIRNVQNFGNVKTFNSCSYFVNGIPVSAAQDNLHSIFPDFELNHRFHKYYIDLWKDGICIEYDGRGHDMEVRMGKIGEEDFAEKERIKKKAILKECRLLRIVDKKDVFKNIGNITKDYLKQIKNFIESNDLYKEIIVD